MDEEGEARAGMLAGANERSLSWALGSAVKVRVRVVHVGVVERLVSCFC